MVEELEEVDFVKLQKRKGGSFLLTVPAAAVRKLGVRDNERFKCYLDTRSKRVIFELLG